MKTSFGLTTQGRSTGKYYITSHKSQVTGQMTSYDRVT